MTERPKIPRPHDVGSGEHDPLAAKESKAFEEERDLEKEAQKNAHKHKEAIKKCIVWAVIVGIIFVASVLLAGILIWAWHLLMPEAWAWLSSDQLKRLQEIMSSALLALIASEYAKKLSK